MVVLIIFPVILQTVINFRMLSTGRQGGGLSLPYGCLILKQKAQFPNLCKHFTGQK